MRRSDSPGNASEVRRINLMFWVTPHENELIRRRMAQAGTANLSAYLRKMAIDGLIVHLELPELKEMISLLRRCAGESALASAGRPVYRYINQHKIIPNKPNFRRGSPSTRLSGD